ncbi:hypothetical protein BGZ76_008969 [Entomortierella beljakovae]|nr:hypothetical protein BGZ76_008969 [Entomortierella beljakovae]
MYDKAKVLVFHDWDPKDLPPKKDVLDNKKVWVLNTAERPHAPMYQQSYLNLFTYKFTYHFGSDMVGSYFIPGAKLDYAFINHVTRPPLRTIQQKNFYRVNGFHNHDNRPLAPVAWVVSNCKAENGRHFMVNQLKKYIDIDIYGHCIPNRSWPKKEDGLTDMTSEELVQHYKFYLAIENANCEDYVTEKLVRAFEVGAVPVVDGPHDYSRFQPATKSLIRYDDFGSPQGLAEYLNKLDQDDNLYLEYLAYKSERNDNNTDKNGNVLKGPPETYNQGYRERLLPWFVDNWDIDTSEFPNKTSIWKSKEGWKTTRAKYGMQWGPDGEGARCELCRIAHDLAEGVTVIDSNKHLSVDNTCTFRKFYNVSWVVEFYPYWSLSILILILAVLYMGLTRKDRRCLRTLKLKAFRTLGITSTENRMNYMPLEEVH